MTEETSTHSPELAGFKTLLLGTPGSGKTHSLTTLMDTGLQVFAIFTEPMDTIPKSVRHHENFHYKYIPPGKTGFNFMIDSAKKINTMNQKMLSNLTDVNKQKHTQFITLLETLANFTDQHGEEFGAVDQFGTDKVVIVDSLSGMNIMAMDLVVGSKPCKSQAEWGIAMDNLNRLLIQLTSLTCHFILTGHLSLDKDELSGRLVQGASTLGKKLAPEVPRFFSDVVKAYRDGDDFYWATKDSMVDLKFRLLPNSDKIDPSFQLIYDEWKDRAHGDQT